MLTTALVIALAVAFAATFASAVDDVTRLESDPDIPPAMTRDVVGPVHDAQAAEVARTTTRIVPTPRSTP